MPLETYEQDTRELLRSIADNVSMVSTELAQINVVRQISRKRMADVYRCLPWWRKLFCTPEKLARTARLMDIAADIYLEELSTPQSYLDPSAKTRAILKGVRS